MEAALMPFHLIYDGRSINIRAGYSFVPYAHMAAERVTFEDFARLNFELGPVVGA
jgi:hypothetical protein